jgi:hypothetical protein
MASPEARHTVDRCSQRTAEKEAERGQMDEMTNHDERQL